MPLLDMSDVLCSPEFCDLITVNRRTESVSVQTGLGSLSVVQFPNVVAVITIASPDDLKRFDASQIRGDAIWFATQFRVQASAQGQQPDQVVWDGVTYTVHKVQPYTRFGAGFVEGIALSMNATSTSHV